MKRKKKLLGFGAYLIAMIIYAVPFINLIKKEEIHADFRDIRTSIYSNASLDDPYILDSLLIIESRVNKFTLQNPVPANILLGDYISKSNISLDSISKLKTDFYIKLSPIEDYYREAERKSNYLMYFFLLLVIGWYRLMKYLINKYVK
ncbi:MAG: hypothetical protein N4A74_10770 [Carboxylicivirga sp.]|nr:hypothetical protein [Carboxylicivirga sp.]